MCIKLLFDQNLSYGLVSRLKNIFPDLAHVAALGLDRASDIDVWKFAKENKYKNKICTITEENKTGIIEIDTH